MKYKFLFLLVFSFLLCNLSHAQTLGRDTVQFVGKKNYKIGEKNTYLISRILLLPDSAYTKADYYCPVNNGYKIFTNVDPVIETGYWILKDNTIFLYSKKGFLGPDFLGKFKYKTNFIKYERRASRKTSGNYQNNSSKSGIKIDKIFGEKPIIKFNKVKVTKL